MTTDGPWLVVGLGNPGAQYASTRHNVGYLTLRRAGRARRCDLASHRSRTHTADVRLGSRPGWCARPPRDSRALGFLYEYLGRPDQRARLLPEVPPARILVIHDDMDLPAHTLRLRSAGERAATTA